MALVFCFFLFIFLIWLLYVVINSSPKAVDDSKDKGMSLNNISNDVSNLDEARAIREKYKFDLKVNELKQRILLEISRLTTTEELDIQNSNKFYISKMMELLSVPITNEDDLREVEWLFNCGELRTNEEVAQRKKEAEDTQYVNSGQYEADCFIRKTAGGFVGFVFGLLLGLRATGVKDGVSIFIGGWIGTFLGLLFSIIGMAIASGINVSSAKEHNVPANHPRYQHDRRELAIAGVSGVVAAGSIGRHTSKAVKDLMNVDGWKEMK